ncbi:MAG: hypothetical protein EBZ48_10860 [Proteobacteria bacterium]|nr:hypothetical protein [Pseudomonadota bacterium]
MDNIPSFSHPDQPVRHSYPLAITADGFRTALGLVVRTSPYIILRLGLMMIFIVAALFWLLLCGGLAYLFSGKNGQGGGGILFFILTVVFPAGVFFWIRTYLFYLLKCGHVAVLTRLITHGDLPQGVNQVQYGKDSVLQHFAQANVLVVVDSLVTGVANAFNRSLDWLSNIIPIPGMESIMKIVHLLVHRATTFIDETILSYTLARGDTNVWRSSMDGLVYYAANVRPILKTAVLSLLLQYVLTLAIFIVCLVPAYLLGLLLPASVASFAWLFAVLLAEGIRSAFLQPIFLVMVALTFHKSVQNQPIDESWAARLESMSSKFGKLKQKALDFKPGEAAATA